MNNTDRTVLTSTIVPPIADAVGSNVCEQMPLKHGCEASLADVKTGSRGTSKSVRFISARPEDWIF